MGIDKVYAKLWPEFFFICLCCQPAATNKFVSFVKMSYSSILDTTSCNHEKITENCIYHENDNIEFKVKKALDCYCITCIGFRNTTFNVCFLPNN